MPIHIYREIPRKALILILIFIFIIIVHIDLTALLAIVLANIIMFIIIRHIIYKGRQGAQVVIVLVLRLELATWFFLVSRLIIILITRRQKVHVPTSPVYSTRC